jgi:hypothetical protein
MNPSKNPGWGPGLDSAFLGRNWNSELTTKSPAAQANIELIRSDIVETIGPMIATLEAALAMAAIPDDAGLKYSLRCARAYWRSISGSAAELSSIQEDSSQ